MTINLKNPKQLKTEHSTLSTTSQILYTFGTSLAMTDRLVELRLDIADHNIMISALENELANGGEETQMGKKSQKVHMLEKLNRYLPL